MDSKSENKKSFLVRKDEFFQNMEELDIIIINNNEMEYKEKAPNFPLKNF